MIRAALATAPPVEQAPARAKRVLPSYVIVHPTPDHWDVLYVCPDCAQTKFLMCCDNEAEAIIWAGEEAERRGVPVVRMVAIAGAAL